MLFVHLKRILRISRLRLGNLTPNEFASQLALEKKAA